MAKFSRSAERELIGNGKSVPTQLLMIMTGKSLERFPWNSLDHMLPQNKIMIKTSLPSGGGLVCNNPWGLQYVILLYHIYVEAVTQIWWSARDPKMTLHAITCKNDVWVESMELFALSSARPNSSTPFNSQTRLSTYWATTALDKRVTLKLTLRVHNTIGVPCATYFSVQIPISKLLALITENINIFQYFTYYILLM